MKIKKFNENIIGSSETYKQLSPETHRQLYDLQTLVSNITRLQDIWKNDKLKELVIEVDRATQKLIAEALKR